MQDSNLHQSPTFDTNMETDPTSGGFYKMYQPTDDDNTIFNDCIENFLRFCKKTFKLRPIKSDDIFAGEASIPSFIGHHHDSPWWYWQGPTYHTHYHFGVEEKKKEEEKEKEEYDWLTKLFLLAGGTFLLGGGAYIFTRDYMEYRNLKYGKKIVRDCEANLREVKPLYVGVDYQQHIDKIWKMMEKYKVLYTHLKNYRFAAILTKLGMAGSLAVALFGGFFYGTQFYSDSNNVIMISSGVVSMMAYIMNRTYYFSAHKDDDENIIDYLRKNTHELWRAKHIVGDVNPEL